MRLMNARTRALETFYDEKTPPYAILSHTWGEVEVTFQDLQLPNVQSMPAYKKIDYLCRQAIMENINYVWIDTCCIDKSSSAELSEAINSMFRWYGDAAICYAYLVDVDGDIAERAHLQTRFVASRWFERGWTLQELLAPREVVFFGTGWTHFGSKSELAGVISTLTGIPEKVLSRPWGVQAICIAARMAWASKRTTTRIEDRAYSLLGIFGINMPLLYGEGDRAFRRLQEELLKISDDQTLFVHMGKSFLAKSPSDFRYEHPIYPLNIRNPTHLCSMTSRGLLIEVRQIRDEGQLFWWSVLNVQFGGNYTQYLAVRLSEVEPVPGTFRKVFGSLAFRPFDASKIETVERKTIYIIELRMDIHDHYTLLLNAQTAMDHGFELRAPIVTDYRVGPAGILDVWDRDSHTLRITTTHDASIGVHAVFLFEHVAAQCVLQVFVTVVGRSGKLTVGHTIVYASHGRTIAEISGDFERKLAAKIFPDTIESSTEATVKFVGNGISQELNVRADVYTKVQLEELTYILDVLVSPGKRI